MKQKWYSLIGWLISGFTILYAQEKAPELVLQADYGGPQQDEVYGIFPTEDGGFVLGGQTDSKGKGKIDVWLIKSDKEGKVQWDKTFGKATDDKLATLLPTENNGWLLVGTTQGKEFKNDIWVAKTNAKGKVIWEKTYGEAANEAAHKAVATKDGGLLIAGVRGMTQMVKQEGIRTLKLDQSIWLLRLDKAGDVVWEKTIESDNLPNITGLVTTKDGGFALLANKRFAEVKYEDAWLIGLKENGDIAWNTTFGGEYIDVMNSLVATVDGGFILAGGKFDKRTLRSDVWLIKTGSIGQVEWEKSFGGKGTDIAYTIIQTADQNFVLGGTNGSVATEEAGAMWLVKVDTEGKKIWDTTLGKNYFEHIQSVYQLKDGSYIVAGFTPTQFSTESKSKQGKFGDIRFARLK